MTALYAQIAKMNRVVVKYWPVALGGEYAFRALSKVAAKPGVRLEAVAAWGGRFNCELHDFVPSRVFYFGYWEPNLTGLLMRRLVEGDVFIDVGANIGYFTVLASKLVGSTGSVVAVEASPSIYRRLQDDIALNSAVNVRAINVAVSDREGTVSIYAGPDENRGATSLKQQRGGSYEADVRAAPLLDLIEPSELARARMMKIDVEGVELPILMDLLANIDRYPARMDIVVEVSPDAMREAGSSLATVIEQFQAHGYNWYVLENRHDPRAYFDTTPRAPKRGTTIPTRMTDIVFSRESGEVLI